MADDASALAATLAELEKDNADLVESMRKLELQPRAVRTELIMVSLVSLGLSQSCQILLNSFADHFRLSITLGVCQCGLLLVDDQIFTQVLENFVSELLSLSVMICVGIPNRQIQFQKIADATLFAYLLPKPQVPQI